MYTYEISIYRVVLYNNKKRKKEGNFNFVYKSFNFEDRFCSKTTPHRIVHYSAIYCVKFEEKKSQGSRLIELFTIKSLKCVCFLFTPGIIFHVQ